MNPPKTGVWRSQPQQTAQLECAAPCCCRALPGFALALLVLVPGVLSLRAQPLDSVSREVSVFNIGMPSANVEAISREWSVFNIGGPSASTEAISREVSIFNLGQPTAASEAVSREVSIFNLGQPTATLEAISREVSVVNLGGAAASLEAISRELSIFNLGQPTATLEAISREISVFMSTNPLPDLVVSILDAPTSATGGSTVDLVFAITNHGPVSADGPWTNQFLLSVDADGLFAQSLGSARFTNSIPAGDSLVLTQSVTLPFSAYGINFIGVHVDSAGNVLESLENNNKSFSSILIIYPPLPDLAVTGLSTSNAALAGQVVMVSWTVDNIGGANATAPWQEKLFLADNPNGSNATLLIAFTATNSLPAGNASIHSQAVILPAGLSGNFWFVVQADSGSQVFEGFGETNNSFVAAQPLVIQSPDLKVSLLTSAATAVFGQPFAVNWGVTNAGNGPSLASWSDKVWLSAHSNSLAGAIVLATVPANGSPLALNGSYVTNLAITIPLNAQSQTGSYWLIVQTDATGAQPESNENDNLLSRPMTLTLPPLPDLTIGNVSAPANALPGQNVLLYWGVTNQGSLSVTGAWSETVFLATNSSGAGAFELATFVFTNNLAIGSTVTRTQSVVLPVASPLGNVWFAVQADSVADVFETTESNNFGVASNPTAIPAVLSLQLSATQVSEGAAQPLRAIVTRNGGRALPLSITITNSDATELSAPTNVVIAAGQASVSFEVFGRTDGLVDGPQAVEILAQAAGFNSAVAFVTVTDVDLPHLALTLNTNVVSEGGAVTATVARNAGTNNSILVQITSSSASQLILPATVNLPAGSNSATFTVTASDDTVVEAATDYTLTVTAPGHVPDGALLTIHDNDIPLVAIDVAADSVSEGAGPQATTVTITRSFPGARPLVVELHSSDTNAVLVPAQVTIPAGALSVSVPVAAVDNLLADATRKADVTGYVLETGVNTRVAEAVPDSLFVTDDDGPTLKLVLVRDLVAEGLNPATTGTVSRNTGTNGALVVNLASSDTTEITVPVNVTIPAGAVSASFPVTTPSDGTNDGNQLATLTAAAPGFTNGTAQITVSDINLPDLIVSEVTAPPVAETEGFVNLGYHLLNQGLSTMASNTILQRVYLSSDPLVGNDLLMGQFTFSGSLPPGGQIAQTFQLRLPQAAGYYWVVIETDAADVVPEIRENNNLVISSAPVHVAAAYGATVSTTLTTAPAGTPVPLVGHATNSMGGPAPFVLVNLHIKVRETHRVVSALTDGQGNFAATWQPLANEAGFYEIAASHPGEANPATQDTFTLLGMKANPAAPTLTVVEHGTNTGLIEVRNLSDVPLTGLSAAVVDQAANLQVAVALFPLPGGAGQGEGGPATNLLGLATNYLRYDITAQDPSLPQGTVSVRITSAEGATLDIPISVTVQSLVPRLVSDPPELVTGMKRGAQRLVNFSVANLGGAASGPISISLPDVPWMNVVNPNPLASLAPGQSNVITLQLTPPADLQLTTFDGALALNATSAGLTVPFKFRALSEAKGDLKITAVDEYTYYAEGSPKVTNATVVVKDALSGELIVTNGLTDANGEFVVTNLNEGYYELRVSAGHHSAQSGIHFVQAGSTNRVTMFLSRQVVQYFWTVTPTEIEDHYQFDIQATFESYVPIPQLIVEPMLVDLNSLFVSSAEAYFELKIKNVGLLAAQNVHLVFPASRQFTFVPLVEDLGALQAQSEIKIPVFVKRAGRDGSSSGAIVNGILIATNGLAEVGARAVSIISLDSGKQIRAFTGLNGKFQFSHLSPGEYRFEVEGALLAPGFDPYLSIQSTSQMTSISPLVMPATIGGIGGSVRDSTTAQPLSNVIVTATADDGQRAIATQTDATGKFALNHLPFGNYHLSVSGYSLRGNRSVSLLPSQPTTNVDFLVSRGGSVAGVVQAESSGSALANVEISLLSTNGYLVYTTLSKSNGQYAVLDIASGDYDLIFNSPSNVWARVPISITALSPFLARNIQLENGESITGKVIHSSNGLGATGAMVVAAKRGVSRKSATLNDGTFHLGGLDEGLWQITVSGDGLASQTKSVNIPRGASAGSIDFEVSSAAALRGRVVLSSGAGFGAALVRVADDSFFSVETRTDPAGFFVFPSLPAATYSVRAWSEEMVSIPTPPITISPGTSNFLTLTLSSGNHVDGQMLTTHNWTNQTVLLLGPGGQRIGLRDLKSAPFSISNLVSGDYSAIACTEAGIIGRKRFSLAGSPVSLDFSDAWSGFVHSRVLDQNANAIAGVLMNFACTNLGLLRSAKTDIAGRCTILLPPGEYIVTASADLFHFRPESVTVTQGAAPAELMFRAGNNTIAGRVRADPGNRLVPNATVTLALLANGTSPAGVILGKTLTNGDFTFPDLAAARYAVVVDAPELGRLSTVVDTTTGSITNLNLTYFEPSDLTLQLRDAGSVAPISNAFVLARPVDDFWTPTMPVTSASDGLATVARQRGKYHLTIIADGYAPETLDIDHDLPRTITVDLRRGEFSLGGVILDTVTRLPIEGATVRCRLAGATVAVTYSDLLGHFAFGSLDTGTYEIQASYIDTIAGHTIPLTNTLVDAEVALPFSDAVGVGGAAAVRNKPRSPAGKPGTLKKDSVGKTSEMAARDELNPLLELHIGPVVDLVDDVVDVAFSSPLVPPTETLAMATPPPIRCLSTAKQDLAKKLNDLRNELTLAAIFSAINAGPTREKLFEKRRAALKEAFDLLKYTVNELVSLHASLYLLWSPVPIDVYILPAAFDTLDYQFEEFAEVDPFNEMGDSINSLLDGPINLPIGNYLDFSWDQGQFSVRAQRGAAAVTQLLDEYLADLRVATRAAMAHKEKLEEFNRLNASLPQLEAVDDFYECSGGTFKGNVVVNDCKPETGALRVRLVSDPQVLRGDAIYYLNFWDNGDFEFFAHNPPCGGETVIFSYIYENSETAAGATIAFQISPREGCPPDETECQLTGGVTWELDCGGRANQYRTDIAFGNSECANDMPDTSSGGTGTESDPYLSPVTFGIQQGCSVPANKGVSAKGIPVPEIPTLKGREELAGICAQIRFNLNQGAIVVRDSFEASLELANLSEAALTDIAISLAVRDNYARDVSELFVVGPPLLSKLSAVDGSGTLNSHETGTARLILTPTSAAAPTVPTTYSVSGTLLYRQSGQQLTIPLQPVSITVHPDPRLTVHYFHQRDVFSDDPFTDAIEPSTPYSLAVMVQNKGFGVAKNFHITSAQPQIVENEKGLLADFKIIATEVAGQNLTPSLSADFGTIDPGGIAIGRWLMTSTIQGLFIDYKATFEHLDGLGNKKLSLIDEVTIHEMIRLVQAGGTIEDGKPDFLVNDLADLHDYPDRLYLSDGTTNEVAVVTNDVVVGSLSPGNLEVQLTAAMPGGWAYLRVPDPANGQYRLNAVVRSDGTNILSDNFWTTDRTFIGLGRRPIRENILHLLDYNSTGSYTLEYELNPALDLEAPSSGVAALPANSRAQFPVNWSGTDSAGGSGVSFYDVYVSEDGGAFRRWLWETIDTSAVYQGVFGKTFSFYSVAVDRSGNREQPPATPDAQTTVTLTNHPPTLGALVDITLAEGQTLLQTLTANDPDDDGLIFSLLGIPPPGLFVNPYSGLLTWVTGEAHGPSTNPVTVQVLDNGAPRLGVTRSFKIFVTDENAPPELDLISNRSIAEGSLLTITNVARDFDLPAQQLTFSLGPGSPTNATIHATSGLFTWRPTELQGGTTNIFTVFARDNGVPPASAMRNFTVIVRDTRPDFVLAIGTTQLLAGASGRVPLTLHSGVDLTNVHLILALSGNGLTNLTLQALAPEVAAADFLALGSNRFDAQFRSRADATLQGDLVLAQLAFGTLSNGPSSVAQLSGESLTGSRASAAPLLNGNTANGRVFRVASEPILDSTITTNKQLALALFARTGERYAIQRRVGTAGTNAWIFAGLVEQTTLQTALPLFPALNPMELFRAYLVPDSEITMQVESGLVVIEWPLDCAACLLEQNGQLGVGAVWTPVGALPQVIGGRYRISVPIGSSPRFYRLAVPLPQ